MSSTIAASGLLSHLAGPESIDSFGRAAISRHRDGKSLVDSARSYWAVYTLGYVVELCLKIAFLRLAGLGSHDPASYYIKKIAPAWCKAMSLTTSGAKLHDLIVWLELIVAERALAKRSLSPTLFVEFSSRVQQVAKHWRPDLRYHPSIAVSPADSTVVTATTWILRHYSLLWS